MRRIQIVDANQKDFSNGPPHEAAKAGCISDHEIALGWALGTIEDNKLLARARYLADCRDLLLLYRIMMEPSNLNCSSPVLAIKKGSLCLWDAKHARPSLIGYSSDYDGSNIYSGRWLTIQAFNRSQVLGRKPLLGLCDLDHHRLRRGFGWDTVARKRQQEEKAKEEKSEDSNGGADGGKLALKQVSLVASSKTEDDIVHASRVPTFAGALSDGDAETLFSFFAVPALRASTVLDFFAEENRVNTLFNDRIRKLVWSAVFCPGPWPLVVG